MERRPAYLQIAAQIRDRYLTGPNALPGAKLPTERRLQADFGVSRATISRALSALSAEGLIETRRGSGAYISAPPLAQRSAERLIAFIAPHIPQSSVMQNPVLLRLYHGIEQRARQLGYQAVTASANFSVAHEESLIERFLGLGAQGVIVYPVYFPRARRRDEAARDHLAHRFPEVPMVLTDIGYEEWNRTLVLFDNRRLGLDMTRQLLRHGRRRILFMHTAPERLHNSVHERCQGWREALRESGHEIPAAYPQWPLPVCDFAHSMADADADHLVDDLLRLDPCPDAVMAWDDGTAMWLIQALLRRGVSVPDDIVVTGFDDHAVGEFFRPAFPTTVADFNHLGEVAMDLLHEQITQPNRRPPRTYLLPASVQWRAAPTATTTAAAHSERKGGEPALRS